MSAAAVAPSSTVAASRERGFLSAAVLLAVAAPALTWWTATDRLDLPKQAVMSWAALVLLVMALARGRHRAHPVTALVGAAIVIAVAASPAEMAARVEGWVGWASAIAIAWGARHAHLSLLSRLAALAGTLAAVALVQALVDVAAGQPIIVTATLGGPGHLAWLLAGLLPCASTLRGIQRSGAVALIAAAIVLSGSRTAIMMVVASLPLWWGGGAMRRSLLFAALVGALAAVSLDVLSSQPRLLEKARGVVDPTGSAHGRAYLWWLYVHHPEAWLGLGHGPEAFVRRFPAMQDDFLRLHPEWTPFRSHLRHAHVDVVEVGVDFGLIALALIAFLLTRRIIRRASVDPAAAGLVAVTVGGLTSPVAFFAPTLAVAAALVGLRIPVGVARSKPPDDVAFGMVPVLLALIMAQPPVMRRLASEVVRSHATWARMHGDGAAAFRCARRSVAWDGRNPRAHLELAMTCRTEACERAALARALRDLPGGQRTDGAEVDRRRPPSSRPARADD